MKLATSLLLCLCLGLVIGGCRCDRRVGQQPASDATKQSKRMEQSKRPGSELLQEYRNVMSLYERGKPEDARKLAAVISNKRLRLAQGADVDDLGEYGVYVEVHLAPALSLLRHVAYQNERYARSLASGGKLAEASDVLAINLEIAQQWYTLSQSMPRL